MELTGGNCHKIVLAIIVGQAHSDLYAGPQKCLLSGKLGLMSHKLGWVAAS